MSTHLKQSVTDIIAQKKKINFQDALVSTAIGMGGVAISAAATLLFPPGGAAGMFSYFGLILASFQAFSLLNHAGGHRALLAAEKEAAANPALPARLGAKINILNLLAYPRRKSVVYALCINSLLPFPVNKATCSQTIAN